MNKSEFYIKAIAKTRTLCTKNWIKTNLGNTWIIRGREGRESSVGAAREGMKAHHRS
jgi:hypothetical protein